MVQKKNVIERKADHLKINLEMDVKSGLSTGLEDYVLEHFALPEINLEDVDTSTSFLGHDLRFPLIISSMTGGNIEGGKINQHLAEAAQDQGVALGLGSQRAMLEQPELISTYNVRDVAKNVPIFGNIGAVQFNYGLNVEDCLRLVEEIKADGLIVHLNPLQEALQPEGQTRFAGLAKNIEILCKKANFPILVKEVGWGISSEAARKLINTGVSALDVAGAGGTSWSQVEAHRIEDERAQRIAFEFREWGISTSDSILQVRSVDEKIPLIASGGIRNGIDAAKCIALGADLCGVAGRILKAASLSTQAVIEELSEIHTEMRIAMFSTASKNLHDLKQNKISRLKG